MWTHGVFTTLYPQFKEADPTRLGGAIYDRLYADQYEDRDAFVKTFVEGGAPLQAQDIRRVDDRFAKADDDQLFDALMTRVGADPAGEGMDIARAVFRGEADERSLTEGAADLARSFASGSNRMLAGVTWMLGKVLPDSRGGQVYEDLTDTLSGYAKQYDEAKSSSMQQQQALQQWRQQERVLDGDNWASRAGQTAVDYLTDPSLLTDTLAGSLPYLVPGAGMARAGTAIGAGAAAARGLTGTRAATWAQRGGMGGMASSAGLLEGSDAAVSTIDQIRDMPQAELEQHPTYQELIKQGTDPLMARELTAQREATTAFAITAPVAAGAGLLSARFEAGLLTGKYTGTGWASAMAREAGEEFVQEGSNQLGQNVALNRPMFEGVPEAGGAGMAAGLAQGTAFKGLEFSNDWIKGRLPDIRQANDIVSRAGKGDALTSQEIDFAQAIYGNTIPESTFERSREAQLEAELFSAQENLGAAENDTSYSTLNVSFDINTGLMNPPQPAAASADAPVSPELDVNFDMPRESGYQLTGDLDLDAPVQPDAPQGIPLEGTFETAPLLTEPETPVETPPDFSQDLEINAEPPVETAPTPNFSQDLEINNEPLTDLAQDTQPADTSRMAAELDQLRRPDLTGGVLQEQQEQQEQQEPARQAEQEFIPAERPVTVERVSSIEAAADRFLQQVGENSAMAAPSRAARTTAQNIRSQMEQGTSYEQALEQERQRDPYGVSVYEDVSEQVAFTDSRFQQSQRIRNERQTGRRAQQVLTQFAPEIEGWWSGMTAGQRMNVLNSPELGGALAGLTKKERRKVLATKDINKVPETLLPRQQLGQLLETNPELREAAGIPSQEQLERYQGYTPRDLEKATVEVPVVIEETGETRMVKQNALRAIEETDAQISKYRALLDCLGVD